MRNISYGYKQYVHDTHKDNLSNRSSPHENLNSDSKNVLVSGKAPPLIEKLAALHVKEFASVSDRDTVPDVDPVYVHHGLQGVGE